jgi:hypothetical protein
VLLQQQQFAKREALMSRANSLKKAIRQIIEHTERAVDEQNRQTLSTRHGNAKTQEKRHKWRTKRSKTTPAVFGSNQRQGTSPNRSSIENSVSPPPSPSKYIYLSPFVLFQSDDHVLKLVSCSITVFLELVALDHYYLGL